MPELRPHPHQTAIPGERFVPVERPRQDRLSEEAWQGAEVGYKDIWAEGLRNPKLVLEREIQAPGKYIPLGA